MKRPLLYKLLLPAGLLFIAFTFVLDHYVKLSDFINGVLKGFGIGLILVSLFKNKFRPAGSHGA